MPRTPFDPLAFGDLPEEPRIPHAWGKTRGEDVVVPSKHFGRLRTHVRRFGKGPPLLLVHGLMTSSYSFRYVYEPLGAHFETIAFDLPGAGRTDKPDVSYGPRELAAFLGEAMRELGIHGCPVVGNSMGGYLAMWLALDEPSAMSRLVDLHSPGLVTPRMRALSFAAHLPIFAPALERLVRRDPEAWAHRNVHYYDETLKSREEAREYAAPLRSVEGRRAFARHLGDTMAVGPMQDFERRLRALDGVFPVPLLLLYARRDPMVPPSVGERLKGLLPQAKFQWLEEASHFAHVDAPQAFLEASLPFLLGTESA
jgi:pimeloyl-ACP methyl ester carboxylesterase